jgi:hypothetical protein
MIATKQQQLTISLSTINDRAICKLQGQSRVDKSYGSWSAGGGKDTVCLRPRLQCLHAM